MTLSSCNSLLGLPAHFRFLNEACKASQEELPQFAAVRGLFGVEEDDFWLLSRKLLEKVVTEGQVSTAKSGSLMAFEGGLMAKSMTEEEAATLMVILGPYLKHLHCDENWGPHKADSSTRNPCTLLPRFYGAFVHSKDSGLASLMESRKCFVIMANVFAGVPDDVLGTMEKLDLKGSADDRAQRAPGAELMDFDLLKRDQKFVPVEAGEGETLLAQLERDTNFLVEQHRPKGPMGLMDYESLPDNIRGAPGLMDYSLLVGVVPRGVPGGLTRLDVCDQRAVVAEEGNEGPWHFQEEERTILVGIIDVLQFWTPKKRIARRLKKLMHMERDDDGEYNGQMLDTVRPSPYRTRFLHFVREALASGSWVDSLPRLHDDCRERVGLSAL